MKPARLIWFDLIRGLAALAVCGGHLCAAMFVEKGEMEGAGPVQTLFYLLNGRTHQAVVVFFVLSGFFVGGSVLAKGTRFSWSDYLQARVVRLWVVLIPALILTLCTDLFLAKAAPDVLAGDYHHLWSSGPQAEGIWAHTISFPAFLGNLFFLQTIALPVFGTNGPLWSLANEFWYYLLFPLMMAGAGLTGNGRVSRGLSAATVAVLMLCLPDLLLFGFLIWLLGVGIWLLAASGRLKHNGWVTAVGVGIFFGGLYFSGHLMGLAHWIPDVATGLCFCAAAIPLTVTPLPRFGGVLIERFSIAVSEISYSLYLCHFPLVAVIVPLVYGKSRIVPDGLGIAQYVGWLTLLIAAGILFWWAFERRTPEVRAWVKTRISALSPLLPAEAGKRLQELGRVFLQRVSNLRGE